MKKLTSLILLSVFVLAGCKSAPSNIEQTNTETNNQNQEPTTTEETTTKKSNKMCDWIDDSDLIIQLDLPEEFALYEKTNSSPSYNTGFLFRSSYGDQARLMRLARKGCDYRVGFSKEDFRELNMAPNSNLTIAAESGSQEHFSYENWPIEMNFDGEGMPTDGIPEEGKTIVIKVTGTVSSFQQYQEVFNF